MRVLRLSIVLALAASRLPAPLISSPNLAKRVDAADTIVVARVVTGITLAAADHVSSDVVLQVERVLKGELVPGATVAAHLEGPGWFVWPNPRQTAAAPLYGTWFLRSTPGRATILSRDGNSGELHLAPVILPDGAPAGERGATPADSVANEIAAGLRWLADVHGAELKPQPERTGTGGQGWLLTNSGRDFRALTEDFRSLSPSTTLHLYRQFAADPSAHMRAVGIAGLIAGNDPEGVKRAAAEWSELRDSADVGPIINNLMQYSKVDADGVRALSTLAIREPPEPGLRENAVYALRAIHTKEALPALIALLDDKAERVRPIVLSGLCLFVRNARTVTPEAAIKMSWLESWQPAPFLNAETQRYCLLGGMANGSADLDVYADFWKSWWEQHRAEHETAADKH